MSDIEVYVAVGEQNLLAGRMYPHRRRGIESASFVYNDRYLADPDAYALDPGLPLVTGTLQTPVGRALFGAFADSAPDRWGRTVIQRAERARVKAAATAPRSMSEVDLRGRDPFPGSSPAGWRALVMEREVLRCGQLAISVDNLRKRGKR